MLFMYLFVIDLMTPVNTFIAQAQTGVQIIKKRVFAQKAWSVLQTGSVARTVT
jgi:hypothetical protein